MRSKGRSLRRAKQLGSDLAKIPVHRDRGGSMAQGKWILAKHFSLRLRIWLSPVNSALSCTFQRMGSDFPQRILELLAPFLTSYQTKTLLFLEWFSLESSTSSVP